ncbi:MAG: formate dehydrogenase accessory sulfurtransferase FdhD [Spirochaetes bacterium]|nr:formate dehydrogenase accessory sulfurtransferase FdhD [Spirochaetota bacterium]
MKQWNFDRNSPFEVYRDYEVWEFLEGKIIPSVMPISMEYAVELWINNMPFCTLSCSGNNLLEQTIGHLYTNGLIRSFAEIKTIDFNEKTFIVKIEITDAEMKKEKIYQNKCHFASAALSFENTHTKHEFFNLRAKMCATLVCKMMMEFLNYSTHYKRTGGVHSAALYTLGGDQISFFDDLGRHNAIDKTIGDALLRKIPLDDKILVFTGRVWGEIAMKAIRSNIPIVIARASPTSLSIEIAKKYGLVLIGKVRENRFVVFNGVDTVQV